MSRFLVLILFAFNVFVLQSQTLTIINKFSGEPVPNAVIVNEDKRISVQTNSEGEANLEAFSENDKLSIIHTSYENKTIDYSKLSSLKYRVFLVPEILQLNEMVISASRRIESKSDIPYRITNLKAENLQIYQPQTSADMLSASREVFVQKSQMGGGSPMIRGFGSNRVLLVVDGVRMNNAIFRHGNLHNIISLDAYSVDGIEVIHGPGSVTYGSDAIGGVFSFATRNPEFSEGPIEVSSNAMVRMATANSEKTVAADVSIANDEFASLTLISFSDYGDLRAGKTHLPDSNYLRRHSAERYGDLDTIIRHTNRHIMHGTAYRFFNIMQKLRYKANENLIFTYGFHNSQTSDIPRFDRLNIYDGERELRYAEWHYGPQKWLMNNLQMEYTNQNLLFDELRMNIAHQNYSESRHNRRFNDNKRYIRFEAVDVVSANLDFFKRIDSDRYFNYGVEAVYNKVNSRAIVQDIMTNEKDSLSTRYPDGSVLGSLAAYVGYKHHINNKFTLSYGARYSFSHINAEFDTLMFNFPFDHTTSNTGAPTASFGAIYKHNSNFNLSLNLSSGFRAPNIDDIAKIFDSDPNSVVVPNEDLKPEYLYSADIGFTKRFGRKLELQGGGFFSHLSNVMVRENFSFNDMDSIMYDGNMRQVQAIVNNDYAVIYGASAGLKADIGELFSLKSHITWIDGFDNNNEPIRHVSPLFGSTHLLFSLGDFSFDLYAVYNGEISPDKLSREEHGKDYMYARDTEYAKAQKDLPVEEQFNPEGLYSPSWHTININMKYQLSDRITVNLAVENITNVMYRTYSSGIPSFGRNYIVGVRGRF